MNNFFNKSAFLTIDLIVLSNLFVSRYNLQSFEILGLSEDDSYISEGINNKGLDKYELNDIDDIMKQEYCEKSSIDLILRKLCYDGFIESGDYLVNN